MQRAPEFRPTHDDPVPPPSYPCLIVTVMGGPGEDPRVTAIVEDPALRVIRIANPLTAPLTVPRIAFQIGDADPMDVAASLASAFAEDASGRPIVLIVQNAETLDDAALRSLRELPETSGPGVLHSILCVASPGSAALAGDERFADLRGAFRAAPPNTGPEPTCLLPARPSAFPPRARRAPFSRLRGAIGAAAILAILAGAAGLLHRNTGGPAPPDDTPASVTSPNAASPGAASPGVAPLPVAPPPVASPGTALPLGGSEPASMPDAAVLLPIPGTPRPPPATSAAEGPAGDAERGHADPEEALARLRSEFGQFLDRAGSDTASLSEAERYALFEEYLAWRRRSASGAGAPAP